MAENPYAAPAAAVADVAPDGEHVLAGRAERFAAALVDGILIAPASFTFWFAYTSRSSVSGTTLALVCLYVLALLAVDLYLLSRNSQTIGKKLVKIKIVRKDGSHAAVSRIFWLRGVLNGVLAAIPYLGGLYGLVDALFIFGDQRRCVHDYIADTIVINA